MVAEHPRAADRRVGSCGLSPQHPVGDHAPLRLGRPGGRSRPTGLLQQHRRSPHAAEPGPARYHLPERLLLEDAEAGDGLPGDVQRSGAELLHRVRAPQRPPAAPVHARRGAGAAQSALRPAGPHHRRAEAARREDRHRLLFGARPHLGPARRAPFAEPEAGIRRATTIQGHPSGRRSGARSSASAAAAACSTSSATPAPGQASSASCGRRTATPGAGRRSTWAGC